MVEQILASHRRSDSSYMYDLFQEHTTIKNILRQEMMRRGLPVTNLRKSGVLESPSPPLQPVATQDLLPALVSQNSEEDSPRQRPVAVISPMHRRTVLREVHIRIHMCTHTAYKYMYVYMYHYVLYYTVCACTK